MHSFLPSSHYILAAPSDKNVKESRIDARRMEESRTDVHEKGDEFLYESRTDVHEK